MTADPMNQYYLIIHAFVALSFVVKDLHTKTACMLIAAANCVGMILIDLHKV